MPGMQMPRTKSEPEDRANALARCRIVARLRADPDLPARSCVGMRDGCRLPGGLAPEASGSGLPRNRFAVARSPDAGRLSERHRVDERSDALHSRGAFLLGGLEAGRLLAARSLHRLV